MKVHGKNADVNFIVWFCIFFFFFFFRKKTAKEHYIQ